MNVIQERDAALARVKELESDNRLLAADVQLQKSTISIGTLLIADLKERLSKRDMLIDSLASDVQAARFASELAAKEREALRQLVRDYHLFGSELSPRYGYGAMRQAEYDALQQRASALLVCEQTAK